MNNIILRGLFVSGLILSSHAFAFGGGIRCGVKLIEPGDNITQLIQACGTYDSTYGQNSYGDNATVTYNKDDGMTYTITLLKGVIQDIDANRSN